MECSAQAHGETCRACPLTGRSLQNLPREQPLLKQERENGWPGIVRATIASWIERDNAGIAAWSAPGVAGVQNDLKVTYPY